MQRALSTRQAAAVGAGVKAGRTTRRSKQQDLSDISGSSSGSDSEDENQPPAVNAATSRGARQFQLQKTDSRKAATKPTAAVDLTLDSSGGEFTSSTDSGSESEGEQAAPRQTAPRQAAQRGRGVAAGRRYAVSRRSKATAGTEEVPVAAAAKAAGIAAAREAEADISDDSDSLQDEDEAGPSLGAGRSSAAAAASRKRSALHLVAGKLDEESLKRMARERPDSINFNLKDALMRRLQACGHKWRFHLRSGNSLLLYGFGSKRALLDQWARQVLTDGAAVTVNGFNPAVTAKQVALAAAAVLLPSSMRGSSAADIVAAIRSAPTEPDQHVYIVLHNIDGPGLRAPEDQALLAELASCPSVHLAASIDHINAPLMWDVKTRARFRWVYQDATTFTPYLAETMDMPPVLLSCFQETTRRGASTALGSMPPTAQAVFRVLAEAQLDDPTSPGITFATLFRMCRERWLVSNEQALRGFLAEFTDHELVAERMASLHGEEREVLYVPMDEDVLRKLLEANAPQ